MPVARRKNVYFNEWTPYCANWLKNLWPYATVSERDIREVSEDLTEYDHVHFFAGIGGWEYALELAKWPLTETVWTGSCPCQPFSTSGKQRGTQDERHVWPEMYRIIENHLPPTIFGEQVAGKLGLEWLDGVFTDLETLGYACGAAIIPVASIGAPHKRERIYWVADSDFYNMGIDRKHDTGGGRRKDADDSMSYDPHSRTVGGVADVDVNRQSSKIIRNHETVKNESKSHTTSSWDSYISVICADDKKRKIPDLESGILPLAYGIPGTVEQIRAYGNAIVPQLAAVFIRSFMECKWEQS